MEHLAKATKDVLRRVWLVSLALQVIIGLVCVWLAKNNHLSWSAATVVFVIACVVSSYFIGYLASRWASQPLAALGQAVLHLAPGEAPTAAPQFENLRIGREYVTNVAYQLYQIASLQDNQDLAEHRREATQASNILAHLPLPVFVFNKQQIVTFGSDTALSYCGVEASQVFGKSLFEIIDLEFPSSFTLEAWVNDCQQNKATDTAYWRRVRIRLKDEGGTMRQCDMAGYYSRDNPTGIEFIISLFDRTEEYSQDDQALGFVALAVHELRTPLTIMRGYIEIFQDELKDKLDPEMTNFMHRLQASGQQLTNFVNNILNVARIEENQMIIKLAEERWDEVINHAIQDMTMRAQSLGKTINVDIAADLPAVAADRLTIYEVLCNLLDNAIKYSGNSREVNLRSYLTKDGLIETTVEDKGLGIPANVLPSLFEKFHRNFRNRDRISGTGLGLYLSKAIVKAHGGDIWVKSKEDEGTTVGFTLKAYSQLADEQKSSDNSDSMVRTAHGWIKNHSLYRR